MLVNTSVFATSWIEMNPQEVRDRAEVVLSGTYDFTSKPIPSDFIFEGLTFKVKNVYQGDAPEKLTVAIDRYDVGLVEEFQNEGGEFLLFLEKSDTAKFLIPVGGLNGMIQFSNGEVENQNKKGKTFYEDILKSNHKNPSSEKNVAPLNNQNSS